MQDIVKGMEHHPHLEGLAQIGKQFFRAVTKKGDFPTRRFEAAQVSLEGKSVKELMGLLLPKEQTLEEQIPAAAAQLQEEPETDSELQQPQGEPQIDAEVQQG